MVKEIDKHEIQWGWPEAKRIEEAFGLAKAYVARRGNGENHLARAKPVWEEASCG
jgi:hypothetical protein